MASIPPIGGGGVPLDPQEPLLPLAGPMVDYQPLFDQYEKIGAPLRVQLKTNLQAVSNPDWVHVQDVEDRFARITRDFQKYFKMETEVEKDQAQLGLQHELKELFEIHKSAGLDSLYFDDVDIEALGLYDFLFYRELTINTFLNRLVYKHEIELFLRKNQDRIIKEFIPSFEEGEQPDIVFIPKFGSDETHRRGRSAVEVEICSKGNCVKKIYFKPRDAGIDSAVIEVFKQINDLPPDQRSSFKNLPVYKIISFSEEKASLWECIEGICPKYKAEGRGFSRRTYPSVGHYIRNIEDAQQKRELQNTLNRLDAVLTAMNCSDLHPENVLIKGEEIIPIDLENIQRGVTTGLGGNPRTVNLTVREQGIIQEFLVRLSGVAFRHILVDTNTLAGLIGSYENIERLTELVIDQIGADGFVLEMSGIELQGLILSDTMNRDVPYFGEKEGVLYYGLVEDGIPIAHKGFTG